MRFKRRIVAESGKRLGIYTAIVGVVVFIRRCRRRRIYRYIFTYTAIVGNIRCVARSRDERKKTKVSPLALGEIKIEVIRDRGSSKEIA